MLKRLFKLLYYGSSVVATVRLLRKALRVVRGRAG